jgi:hypothetical protein
LQEVAAARTINERGVLVVGTAHSSSLSSLLCNSELSALVGGATSVTLGDELAQASRGDWKVGGRQGLLDTLLLRMSLSTLQPYSMAHVVQLSSASMKG